MIDKDMTSLILKLIHQLAVLNPYAIFISSHSYLPAATGSHEGRRSLNILYYLFLCPLYSSIRLRQATPTLLLLLLLQLLISTCNLQRTVLLPLCVRVRVIARIP
jgi:hypothetical protein